MIETIRLLPYDSDSPLLTEALVIYGRVWPARDPAEAAETFPRYAGYDGFRGLVAFVGDEPAGVGYGARSVAGIPWHDLVAPVLGADHPALQDAWRFVELAVVEEHRGRRIGARLHDALLASQPCPRALISTGVDNLTARRMYERRGWRYIATDFEAPGQGRYVIMALEMAGGKDARNPSPTPPLRREGLLQPGY